ncbi:MAG: hypothetical protein QG630_533 [Patescibacteria group bacterium]|nr:hypothetical protein [Patescibacteria group bacterium]MDQ1433155.1 hypothetical protein [Patescibacteria group bacterium]
MSRLTVKEYATIHKTSVQNVYKHIKSGTLEAHTIDNIKYIIIKDEIDYEKKFNDLQHKYEILNNEFEAQKELINILKEDRKLFSSLIEYRKEVEEVTTKKKKKKKKK